MLRCFRRLRPSLLPFGVAPLAYAFLTYSLAFALLPFTEAQAAPPAPEADSKPLTLAYGANRIDINADGIPDLIVKARWENFNAHSFDRYLIMVRLKDPARFPQEYYEVAKGTDGADSDFHTTEGADCLVVGYTFALNRNGVLLVTRFARDAGVHHYCEPKPVTLTTYLLSDSTREQGQALPGLTPFYLKPINELKTHRAYADVRELMR